MTLPIFVGREKSKRAVAHAMSADRRIFATAQKRTSDDDPAPEDLYQVGVTANIVEM